MSRANRRRRRGAQGKRAGLVQDEITRVAAVCFGAMGYRATTLNTVAARVGISKVTLYTHVSSKEELLWRVFERTIEAFRTGLRQITEQALPSDEKLRRIIRYQVSLLAGHQPFLTVFFGEEASLPAELARRVAQEKRQYDRAIESVVREGITGRRFRQIPPTLLVFGLLGMCNWLYKWYRPDGKLRPEEIGDIFVDLLECGYLERSSRPEQAAVAPALRRIERRLAALEKVLSLPPAVAGSRSGATAKPRPRSRRR